MNHALWLACIAEEVYIHKYIPDLSLYRKSYVLHLIHVWIVW